MIWCLVLILLNGFLVFLANVLEIVTIISPDIEMVLINGREVMYFWYQMLIANNGILFLFLFKHLAQFKSKTSKKKKVKKNNKKRLKKSAAANGAQDQSDQLETTMAN